MGPWPKLIEHPKMDVLSQQRRGEILQQRVRVEIAPDQSAEGWLLSPPGPGSFPAVLVVYSEPETSVGLNEKMELRDFGWQLARRGFVTLSIGTPGGDAWKPRLGGATCQPLSFYGYVADELLECAGRSTAGGPAAPSGIAGHSYGGKWALFAAAWDKFACVAVSDPGIVFDETRPNINTGSRGTWDWTLPRPAAPVCQRPIILAPERMARRWSKGPRPARASRADLPEAHLGFRWFGRRSRPLGIPEPRHRSQ